MVDFAARSHLILCRHSLAANGFEGTYNRRLSDLHFIVSFFSIFTPVVSSETWVYLLQVCIVNIFNKAIIA